jgi:hypothetical protein
MKTVQLSADHRENDEQVEFLRRLGEIVRERPVPAGDGRAKPPRERR